ncbi:hypothetical protein [Neobacillus drentensis]|uniref:hypothetical protein n=2 Tax=Neobacillus drentensis TaxID=220684 RepID=UPI001471C6C3|nr:hypothetical protein [Neobacillus drentensis]
MKRAIFSSGSHYNNYTHEKIGNDSSGGENKMTIDPNLRGSMLDDEWNSEEVQNEIMFTGITRDQWLEDKLTDDDSQEEEEHDDFVW